MNYSPLLGISAPEFGWTPPIRYLLRRARILALAKEFPNGNLLEVGCGAGALLCDFSRLGFKATGLETSEQALATAREIAALDGRHHQIASQAHDAWTGSFDVVCAFDVLEHIENDAAAIDNWIKWVSPGGILLLSVPAHQQRWGAGDIWAGHWRRYERPILTHLLESHGLNITHLECYGFPLANLTEWAGEFTYQKMLDKRGTFSKKMATDSSGIDRRSYSRLSKIIASAPGRLAMRAAMAAQFAAKNTDWGSGYLVAARKP